MKIKLNTLVAAVVLAASSMSANAIITAASSTTTGSSEFVFSAWDANAGIGYTYDLNWDRVFHDLAGLDSPTTATGNAAVLTNARVASSLIGADGVIFDDVLTGFSTANFADFSQVQWNLGAIDVTGRRRVLFTQGDSGPLASTNQLLTQAATNFQTYALNSNGFIIQPAEDTFAVTNSTNGPGYAGIFGSTYNNTISDTTNVLGASTSIFLLAQTTTVGSQNTPALNTQLLSFDNAPIIVSTYLQNDEWRLRIAAVPVAAVPEPETYAMLLAGLGLVAGIARRRNKAA